LDLIGRDQSRLSRAVVCDVLRDFQSSFDQIVAGPPAPRIYIRLYNESFSKNLTSTGRMDHRAVLIAIEVGQVDCRRRKVQVRRRGGFARGERKIARVSLGWPRRFADIPVAEKYTFRYVGIVGTFSGPTYSGAFEFLPQSGDCLLTPLTQVAVLAQGTITS